MKILPIYFLFTVLIMFVFLYLYYPEPKVVLIEPDINEDISQIYKDENNVCYRYHKKEIKCNNK